MAWRPARSIEVLTKEIRSRWPGTSVWTIGDEAHVISDHRPNAAGVVCAADVLGDGGMPLAWFAGRVVAVDPPALKYVIYNRRIWFPGYGWSSYNGSNPHTGHVHVSVGWGPDGRSTGPYDDTSPWGIKEDDMALTETDLGRIAEAVWAEGLPNPLRDYALQPARAYVGWTDAHHQATREHVDARVAEVSAAVRELLDRPVATVDHDVLADAIVARLPSTGLTADDVKAVVVDVLRNGVGANPTG